MAQKPALALDAATIARERAVSSDYTMAGYNHSNWIGAIRQAHRPYRARMADSLSETCVRNCCAKLDLSQCMPHFALKIRARGLNGQGID